ncbi:MAG: peptidoglycan DD-metalloendopeptidase family protein [Sulfurospirillaceae bacterium]|nr:peptidoglycan DD-metalloendopeptidase family protein [Sulfurospirillaceae bacterium]
MKIFLALVILLYSFSQLEANTDKEIKNQAQYLSNKKRLEKKIGRKFKDLASQIISQMSDLDKLKNKISNLDKNIASNEKDIQIKSKTLNDLQDSNQKLIQEKKDLESKIINIIAKDFSYYLISDKNYIETKDSIVIDEVIKKMNVIVKKEFAALSKQYAQINKNIDAHQGQIKTLKSYIADSKAKKKELVQLIKKRELAIKMLAREKDRYKKRLARLDDEKKSIRATLEKLKILKRSEEERARIQRKHYNQPAKLNVRQIGSSYQSANVRKYRGRKTIAPLDSFFVKRKFGNYIDPIYNIKIFNESVVLESKIGNAKVKNVLNGKVVFARDTAVLDKVVIVENSNGIHTIYAHLSQIAPTIRVGKKILKGYIIGRVKDDLTFEVTQKNYHIDPLDLIALSN